MIQDVHEYNSILHLHCPILETNPVLHWHHLYHRVMMRFSLQTYSWDNCASHFLYAAASSYPLASWSSYILQGTPCIWDTVLQPCQFLLICKSFDFTVTPVTVAFHTVSHSVNASMHYHTMATFFTDVSHYTSISFNALQPGQYQYSFSFFNMTLHLSHIICILLHIPCILHNLDCY